MTEAAKNDLRVGAFVAIVDDKGRLLLLHRNDRDQWCMPGGLFEVGESVAHCAIRECREEIGVDIELERVLGIYSDPKSHLFHMKDGVTRQYITIVFRGKIISGEPKAHPSESRDLRFFTHDELPPVVPSHLVWIEDAFSNQKEPFIK